MVLRRCLRFLACGNGTEWLTLNLAEGHWSVGLLTPLSVLGVFSDASSRRWCTSSKPFGQKVLKIKRVLGSSGLPFKLPFVDSVTAGAVRAYAA